MSHRVAAYATYGCSLDHIGLQPRAHTVAASNTWGCSLGPLRLVGLVAPRRRRRRLVDRRQPRLLLGSCALDLCDFCLGRPLAVALGGRLAVVEGVGVVS